MKKVFRKLCVFLLAVTFFGKSLYGDIQYALADEYTGPEVTVTEDGEVIEEEPSVPSDEEEPGEDTPATDVSGGDVSGSETVDEDVSGGDVSDGDVSEGDVSEGDVSEGDVSEGDVSGGDVSGGDVEIEDDPTPGTDEPELKRNDAVMVNFYVLKAGFLESIIPEQNGTEVTNNRPRKYVRAYTVKKDSVYTLEYIKEHFSEMDMDSFANDLKVGRINKLHLPEEYVYFESITEDFGVKKEYGEGGREYLIEGILGNEEYIASMFVMFMEQNAEGSDTGNLIYATGDMIDWYVLKDADQYGWHSDGYMSQGKVLVHENNKPVGVGTVYTYDGTSKVSDEAAVVNTTIAAADDNLPGNYVVKSVVYKDANGNAVTDMINVGNYTAVATVNYVYEATGDEASYASDDIEVLFPVVINKRPVTITANNNSKYVGQADPVLTGRIEGAIASDSVTAVFWRITGNESRGTYPIYVTVTKASANYDVKTYDGVFTIYENTTPGPNPPTPGPTPPAPGPQEEYPGVVPPAPAPEPTPAPTPAPVVTPAPEPVIADETVEVEEDDVPLADALEPEEEDEDSDTLDVGDVYPPLRDLTIEDDETPLAAAPGECWIHWLIVLLTAVDVLYTVIQAFRNGAVIKKLKNENK